MTKQEIVALQKLRPDIPHFQDDYAFACYCAFYLFARDFCKRKAVLDAACGYGYGSRLLAEVAESVMGVDISEAALDYSKSRFQRPNLDFQYQDVTVLDLPESFFDVVVSIETFEHFPSERTDAFITAVQRVLKPGGKLILSTPVKEVYDQIAKTDDHINEVSAKAFMTLFEKNFETPRFFLARRNAMKSRRAAHDFSKRDRLGLRKLIPAEIRKRLKRGLAGGVRQSLPKLLDYWQVSQSDGPGDLETALFQIVVCTNPKS